MFKAGATFRDKNRIRKLYRKGMNADDISNITRVQPKHVAAIIKQIQSGTLHVSAAESRTGGGNYDLTGGDGDAEDGMDNVRDVPRADQVAIKKIEDANAAAASSAEATALSESENQALRQKLEDAGIDPDAKSEDGVDDSPDEAEEEEEEED